MLAARSGIFKEGKYGLLFKDEEIKKSYPFFSGSKLLGTSREWILDGEWDATIFDRDIQLLKEQLREREPREILRNNSFPYLEDDQIQAGFRGLLQDCYDGVLTLNEYVDFIQNSFHSREYGISLPETIDWNKICAGIEKRFETNIREHDDEGHVYSSIGTNLRALFTDDELRAYDMISTFREKNQMILCSNEREYTEELRTSGVSAFITFRNKSFNVFTEEMAVAVAYCFDHCTQPDKCNFPGYFEDMWGIIFQVPDVQREQTKAGFIKLIDLLQQLKINYADEGRKIASVHAETLIKVINKILESAEERQEESTGA